MSISVALTQPLIQEAPYHGPDNRYPHETSRLHSRNPAVSGRDYDVAYTHSSHSMMRKVAEESTSKLRHSNHGVVLYKDVMVPCAELDRDLSISLLFFLFFSQPSTTTTSPLIKRYGSLSLQAPLKHPLLLRTSSTERPNSNRIPPERGHTA